MRDSYKQKSEPSSSRKPSAEALTVGLVSNVPGKRKVLTDKSYERAPSMRGAAHRSRFDVCQLHGEHQECHQTEIKRGHGPPLLRGHLKVTRFFGSPPAEQREKPRQRHNQDQQQQKVEMREKERADDPQSHQPQPRRER